MSDLDNAINSINESAVKAENTAGFLDDMSTFDDQSSVTNPNNGQTVASIPKQVKDRTDELFAAAESDINQAVSDAAQSATDAQDAADSIGRYQGLWPDTGGIADKGDTYQTQVSGTPTGQYFTALQNTTADPVGDDVNWREVVSPESLSQYTDIVYKSSGGNSAVDNMIAGIPIELSIGDNCKTGGTTWKRISTSGGDLSDFIALTTKYATDFLTVNPATQDCTSEVMSAYSLVDDLLYIGDFKVFGTVELNQEKKMYLGPNSRILKLKEDTTDTAPAVRVHGNQAGIFGAGESSRVYQTTSGGYDALTDLTQTGIVNVGPSSLSEDVNINFWAIDSISIWGDLDWYDNDQSGRPGLVETCSQGFGNSGSNYNGMCGNIWFRQLSTGHLKTSICNGSQYDQFNFYRMTRSCINIDAINRTGDPSATNFATTENIWTGFFVHFSAGTDVIKTTGRARGNTFIGNAEPGNNRNGRLTRFYNFNEDSWRNTVIGYGNTGNSPVDEATANKNPSGGNFALDNTNLRQGSPSTFSNFPTTIETADIEILTSKVNVDSGTTVRKPFIKSVVGNANNEVIKVTFSANQQQFMIKLDIAGTGSTTSASRSSQYMVSGNTGSSGTVQPNVDLIGGDDINITTITTTAYELIIGWTPGSSSFNTAQGDLLVTSAGSGVVSVEIL